MQKAFKYRIYPTKKQETIMAQTLGICCELYNAGLRERREAYRLAGISITYKDQQNQLPEIKKTRTDLKDVHSLVLQDVLRRLDKAFQAFFRRVKAGGKAGFPRYRSRRRYDSMTYSQSGFEIRDDKLALSKIGHIKIKLHRSIEGNVKTCTIRRTATRKWFACFSCEVEAASLPATVQAAGIDAGLCSFAHLSDNARIENPRFFRQEEKALAKAQKKLSATPRCSCERRKRRKVVARIHERTTNKRHNFAHQKSREIVNKYGVIAIEKLNIKGMVRNHCLAKSITDAAWSMFFACLFYKAESADRMITEVPAAHTSTDCHRCGYRRTDLTLADRIYHCPNSTCKLVIDRDHNAALNILALGLQSLGLRPKEAASVYGAE